MYAFQFLKRNRKKEEEITETISPLFWNVFQEKGYVIPKEEDKKTQFTFALHPEEKILKLAFAQNKDDPKFLNHNNFANQYGWEFIDSMLEGFSFSIFSLLAHIFQKFNCLYPEMRGKTTMLHAVQR